MFHNDLLGQNTNKLKAISDCYSLSDYEGCSLRLVYCWMGNCTSCFIWCRGIYCTDMVFLFIKNRNQKVN